MSIQVCLNCERLGGGKGVDNLLEEKIWEHNLEVRNTFPTNSFPFRMDGCQWKTFQSLSRLNVSAKPLS